MAGTLDTWLQNQHSILEYFDQTDLLHSIQETAKFYEHMQDKAFHFKLNVDPTELLQLNVEVGNRLLSFPSGTARLFQEVVFAALRTLTLLPQCVSASQVVVSFQLQSLPPLPEYQLQKALELTRCAHSQGYRQYTGFVTGMSTLHKYTKSARYVCPSACCEGSEGNKFIRLHTAGAREAQTIRSDFKCSYCGLPLQEDISSRVLADKLVLELVDVDALSSLTSDSSTSEYHQSLVLYMRDELIENKIEIGQKLTIIGVPAFDVVRSKLAFELNNIIPQTSCDESASGVEESLPDKIRELYRDRRKSPWSFALSLAFAFADHITAAGTFLHLKLGLLLSLVGTSQDKGGLDLLIFGTDSLLLHRLLSHAASIAEHAVVHSTHRHLTASVVRDKHDIGVPFIEGGSVLLARGGICVIPQLDATNKQTKYTLLQVLESNSVLVDVTKKITKHQEQHIFLPRRCSIWSYSNVLSPKRHRETEDFHSESIRLGRDMVPLVDAFGMCYFGEVPTESYAESLLSHHVLMHAKGFHCPPLLSQHDFTQRIFLMLDKAGKINIFMARLTKFVTVARSRSVEFTEEAESLIKDYYVASRRTRGASLHADHFPITAVTTLTRLAEAHAKLSLRPTVSECDATMAILLYEEAITFRTGYSVLNIKPLVHIADNNLQDYIGPKRDGEMLQFQQRLKMFLANHAGARPPMLEEE